MATPKLSDAVLRKTYNAVKQAGDCCKAAKATGMARATIQGRYREAMTRLGLPDVRALNATGTSGVQRAPAPGVDAQQDQHLVAARTEASRFRKAYTDIVKDRAAEERLIALFRKSITALPALPATHFKGRLRPQKVTGGGKPEVPILLRSDQQIGEIVTANETDGVNEYDFGVFQDRLEALEDRTLDILGSHQQADMPQIVIPYLGDNISGRIHDELQKYGHQHVIDQTYLGACAEALFLYRMLKFGRWSSIVVPCVSGNHGRLGKEKEFKQYYKNFDYLFASIMATLLRNVPQIKFVIPQRLFLSLDVAEHRILLSHGHELPPSSLGIPLYSINRASAGYQELLAMSGKDRFQYWFMGHFHRPLELDGSFVNGTMVGLSEMGIGRFKPIVPMQRLFGFHPKWGRAWEYPIRLDRATPAKVYRFEHAMAPTDALDLFAESTKQTDKAAA